VLRTVNDQPTSREAIQPCELSVLPGEFGRVDAALCAPFPAYFDARIGRPSIPVETHRG